MILAGFDTQSLFGELQVVSYEKMTLAGNRLRADWQRTRLQWNQSGARVSAFAEHSPAATRVATGDGKNGNPILVKKSPLRKRLGLGFLIDCLIFDPVNKPTFYTVREYSYSCTRKQCWH